MEDKTVERGRLVPATQRLGNVVLVYVVLQRFQEMVVVEAKLIGKAGGHHCFGQFIGHMNPFGNVHNVHGGHL